MIIKEIRKLVKENKDSVYDYSNNYDNLIYNGMTIGEIDLKAQRVFDKTITILKLALNKFGAIFEDVEDNWIVYKILLQHKNYD
jgi:ParB family chromosome partitioning protein